MTTIYEQVILKNPLDLLVSYQQDKKQINQIFFISQLISAMLLYKYTVKLGEGK